MSQLGETTMNDHLVLFSGLLIIAAWLMPVCVRAEVGEYTDAEIKEKFAFISCLAHGDEEAAKAYIQAGLKFGFADPENKIATTSSIAKISAASAEVELPTAKISAALFEGEGVGLAKIIVEAGLAKSTSDARRLVQGNAVSIDDVKVNDVNKRYLAGELPTKFILKTGKKNFKQIVIE